MSALVVLALAGALLSLLVGMVVISRWLGELERKVTQLERERKAQAIERAARALQARLAAADGAATQLRQPWDERVAPASSPPSALAAALARVEAIHQDLSPPVAELVAAAEQLTRRK